MPNTTLDTYEELAAYKLCIYGPSFVGKTALACQLAKIWKLWYFDLEDGIKTALKPSILDAQYRKNINVFKIPTRQSAPMGIETLLKVIKGGECNICWLHGKVTCPECMKVSGAVINTIDTNKLGRNDCLVIDSSTQLSVDARAAALGKIIRDATTPEDFVLDRTTGGKDFKYPQAVTFMLDKIFCALQTANFNSVVISHEVMTEALTDTAKKVGASENQPSTGEETVFPVAGSRNYSRQFGRFFDMLIHLEFINNKHRAFSSTTHSSLYQTGSRLPWNIEDMKGADGNVLPPFEAIVKMFDPSCREELLKMASSNVVKLASPKTGAW